MMFTNPSDSEISKPIFGYRSLNADRIGGSTCLPNHVGALIRSRPLIRLVSVHHLAPCVFERLHRRLDLRGKDRAIGRQGNLPRGAHKELHAEFCLERGDGTRDGCGCHVQFARYLGEIPLLGGQEEGSKGFVIVHIIVSNQSQFNHN
jgi:hypothetical protein